MPFKLLIADSDVSYATHLSDVFTRSYADTYEVDLFTDRDALSRQLASRAYDAALLDVNLLEPETPLNSVRLPVLLVDQGQSAALAPAYEKLDTIHRYQRISLINSELLEKLARVTPNAMNMGNRGKAGITAVFSAAGGSGKSTVAVAYAMRMAAHGKRVLYFSLEAFAGTHAFFPQQGKGLSHILQNMSSDSAAHLGMLLQAVKQQDAQSGIAYISMPDNYEDISVIDEADLQSLMAAVTGVDVCDELVVDMSSTYNAMSRKLLEMADHVVIVTEPAAVAAVKLDQFLTQHNLFESILPKTALVINKATNLDAAEAYRKDRIPMCHVLPSIKAPDPLSVSRSLSAQPLPFTV